LLTGRPAWSGRLVASSSGHERRRAGRIRARATRPLTA
jgi:hypothetical protein